MDESESSLIVTSIYISGITSILRIDKSIGYQVVSFYNRHYEVSEEYR